MSEPDVREGAVPFGQYQTWYRITGELDEGPTPLVVVHGGPGCSHDYLEVLAAMADTGRAVVHYDQIGGGRSTHLPDQRADFWTVGLFLDELDNLLQHLGIGDRYHLLGQSWGGMLGAEHATRRPLGLQSLVLSNSPASMALWASEAKGLRAQLPAEVAATLDRHEAEGTYEDPAYKAATDVYYERHVCRVRPKPAGLVRTEAFMAEDPTVYHTMNGPNEFLCIGSLREWTIIDRLGAISAPTLLISGRFDEATPVTVQPFADGIADVRWENFEESSHMPFVEEPERYREVVEAFLASHD